MRGAIVATPRTKGQQTTKAKGACSCWVVLILIKKYNSGGIRKRKMGEAGWIIQGHILH